MYVLQRPTSLFKLRCDDCVLYVYALVTWHVDVLIRKAVISAVRKVIILLYASHWRYQIVAFNNGRPVARKVKKLRIYQPILQLRLCSSVQKNSVLLQTARANIKKPDDNDAPVNARLYVTAVVKDVISQRAYRDFSCCHFRDGIRYSLRRLESQ